MDIVHITPPKLEPIGLRVCHSCGKLVPEEAVLCAHCDAYVKRRIEIDPERNEE